MYDFALNGMPAHEIFFADLPKTNNLIFLDKEKLSLTIDVHIK